MPGARLRRRATGRGERGAVAVETALVLTFFLLPLFTGLVNLGNYFWQAQRVDTLAPAVPAGTLSGTFTCQGLVAAVRTAVLTTVTNLNVDLPTPLQLSDISAQVTDVLPDVGAVVRVHVDLPVVTGLASLLPLPNGGNVVTDFSQRLDDVRLTTAVCQ